MEKKAAEATDNLLKGIFGEEPTKILTDAEKEGLKGRVKRIKQNHYKAFERDGNVYLGVQEGEYYEDKNKITTYNEGGRKLENVSLSNDGRLFGTTYNENGKESEIINYSSVGVIESRHTRKYNEDGDIVEMISYDNKGELTSKSIYTHYAKGKELIGKTFDKGGVLIDHRISTYDKNGGRIELKITNAKGELTHWSKWKNNNKGHAVENAYYKPDGSLISSTSMYEYYDAAGDLITSKTFNKKSDKYTSQVEKDKHGNWIKKMSCYMNKAAFIYIREIEYFDEVFVPAETFSDDYFKLPLLIQNLCIEPISIGDLNEITPYDMVSATVLDAADAKFVTEKSINHENFSFLAYYVVKNNEFPSVISYKDGNVETRSLLKELEQNLYGRIINSVKTTDSNGISFTERYTIIFPDHPEYMVHASDISRHDMNDFEEPPFLDGIKDDYGETLHLSDIVILLPSDASGMNDENNVLFIINECIENSMVEVMEDKPKIYMVQVNGAGSFTLQSHAAKDDFEIEDLDIQYGYGFEAFHDELMDRFKNENQGLILFHGLPGTGKTYYIRHLLREMAISEKIVIYMPPNMVDYLVEPTFMTFLSQLVTTYSAQGKFCVLLIEDAEPLLASRNTNGRIQGVSNLLNMTDGLLNDMLKLQIICTFNVDLKELDAALLRPGRLIARKEFKALGEIEANLLAQSLGIKHYFKAPATLSEIYAKLKNKSTLIHEE